MIIHNINIFIYIIVLSLYSDPRENDCTLRIDTERRERCQPDFLPP